HDDERGGDAALRNWNTGRCWSRECSTHTRNDFIPDPCKAQRLALLAATTKDKRIAAFESHDHVPRARLAHEQLVNELLRRGCAAALLADKDAARIRRCLRNEIGMHETVVDDDVRALQTLESTHRDE